MSFTPHMEILPPPQQLIWPKLKPSIDLGMVLYRGTAIALRLGHRHSVDFDFFTEKPLDRDVLQEVFPFLNNSTVLQDQPNAVTVLAQSAEGDHVKISFSVSPRRSADLVTSTAPCNILFGART